MENQDITIFAETNFRDQRVKFGIKGADRRRHVYVVGKTGTGKTTLSENMAVQDIKNGKGVGVVDPHGEFAEKMLDFVPPNRINDVIYFNPADLDFPIAFNVLEKVDAEYRHLVASGLMGVFKKIWPDVWSARMEYILHNSVLALLEYPGSTLLGINRILADSDYRQKVVDKVTDPSVKSFWINEFAKYPDRFREEAVAPIQNKVGQFISSPLIRNIIGQTKSSIDFRDIMDGQKIFIANLSKGKIGEDASKLLGALCITKLQLAAMSRVNVPEEERKDFFLFVDEFQNFATESFATILSEARKYRLCLTLAHQYIGQLVDGDNTTVKDAIFGNVGTMITFRVGAADAEFLEKEYEPEFAINDLISLGFGQIYLKLMIDGFSSRPFSANTLPPFPRDNEICTEKIVRVSRERYTKSRREIEEKIAKWSGIMNEEPEPASRQRSLEPRQIIQKSPPAGGPIFIDNCWECGKKVELKFQPDGVRPIYCKDCLIRINGNDAKKPIAAVGAKSSGSPVIKETGAPISLSEAIKQKPAAPRRNDLNKKKPRQEVDLSGLREVLEEAIGPIHPHAKDFSAGAQKNPAEAGLEKTVDNQKEIKAGEEVDLGSAFPPQKPPSTRIS